MKGQISFSDWKPRFSVGQRVYYTSDGIDSSGTIEAIWVDEFSEAVSYQVSWDDGCNVYDLFTADLLSAL